MLAEIQIVRQSLWTEAGVTSVVQSNDRARSDHPFPVVDGVSPRSVQEEFELAGALGDHDQSVWLAERAFGRRSKEYGSALARSEEAAFRKTEHAALQRFLRGDWAGAAAAYREMVGHAEEGRKGGLLMAGNYCEQLARSKTSGNGRIRPNLELRRS